MSNLVDHANRELRLAGLFDEDSDYGGMLAEAVVELIGKFSEQGHSGASAHMTRKLFNELSAFNNLTPLTNDPHRVDECERNGYRHGGTAVMLAEQTQQRSV